MHGTGTKQGDANCCDPEDGFHHGSPCANCLMLLRRRSRVTNPFERRLFRSRRDHTPQDDNLHSRGAICVRAFAGISSLPMRGAGNAGRWPHPQALCAKKENAHKSVQVGRHDRHSLRNGFTAYSALSLVSGRSSHHPPGLLTPGVDPSVGGSGPHGLTVRPRCIRLPHRKRPSRPAQRFVTMAKRLFSEREMTSLNHNFFLSEREIF